MRDVNLSGYRAVGLVGLRRTMKEVAPSPRDDPNPTATGGGQVDDRLDRHAFLENVMQVEVDVPQVQL